MSWEPLNTETVIIYDTCNTVDTKAPARNEDEPLGRIRMRIRHQGLLVDSGTATRTGDKCVSRSSESGGDGFHTEIGKLLVPKPKPKPVEWTRLDSVCTFSRFELRPVDQQLKVVVSCPPLISFRSVENGIYMKKKFIVPSLPHVFTVP